MKDGRVIKKYPNRRLYDTTESRYITLSDIKQLVVKDERFQVIDKKSGEDITRSILLHVIAEREESGASVMSENFLTGIIKAYDSDTSEIVGRYLEESLSRFPEQSARTTEGRSADLSGGELDMTGVEQKNSGSRDEDP